MKDGQRLLAELAKLGPHGLHPRAPSADQRRRVARAEVGFHQRLPRGRRGAPRLRLDDPRPHLRHLLERGREAATSQIGFMPRGAVDPSADRTRMIRSPNGASTPAGRYPPRTTPSGRDLVHQWAKHCVERYGRRRSSKWWWEVVERAEHPLLAGHARGIPPAARLRDRRRAARAADGPRRRARHAGGAGRPFLRDFLEHCLRGTNYADRRGRLPARLRRLPRQGGAEVRRAATSAWASPSSSARSDAGFAIVASFPELKGTPIVIGESDPEGCAACHGPQLGYRNGTMYSSYTAASFARKLDLARSTA